MTINWDKPIQQRNGNKAELVYRDLTGQYPMLVVITNGENKSYATFTIDGLFSMADITRDQADNIINAPERQEWFINCYPDRPLDSYSSLINANNNASSTRIGPARKLIVEDGKIWIEEI